MWRNRSAFRPNVLELVDALFADEGCPPALVVFVDAWTSYGGSQFLDSPGVGNYHTYLCDEVVPFVDARYRTLADAAHRGIAGKSSGGYGAMVTPMLRPDLFGGLATHAGDALFELCYLPDFRDAVRALRDAYDGSFDAFWKDFRSRPAFTKGTRLPAAQHLGDGRVLLGERGRLDRPAVRHGDGAAGRRRLGALARVGSGAHGRRATPTRCAGCARSTSTPASATSSSSTSAPRRFRRALERIGVTDVFFELFDGTHSAHRVPLPARAALPRRAAPADVGRIPQVLRHVAALQAALHLCEHLARGTRPSSSSGSSASAA